MDLPALFDEHHLPLFRFAYRMTGSAADAEDIVQECFLQLLRPGGSYDPARTPVRTYLFGIVRNQSLKRRTSPESAGENTHNMTPESMALQTELERVIANAVMQLPESQREVLILAHYEQLPLADIAGIVGIEVTAVKSRLQRARAELKERLAAYAPGPERRR
jgi:RNA polymerase sigma-70 factor (ECF subfamily)